MSDIPNLSPPEKDLQNWHWHHQFTVPLLFDDCLSLLQKVCALWAKLNDVIGALNDFNNEFNTWAKNVESQLQDLYNKYNALETRVTKTEQDIANIKTDLESIKNNITNILTRLGNIESELSKVKGDITTIHKRIDIVDDKISTIENSLIEINKDLNSIKGSITNINNRLSTLESNMTSLTSRVKTLEDLLKNLNIIPPVDIYNVSDETFASGLWANWWEWLQGHLTFTTRLPASGWEYSSNVVWWDSSTHLPRYFQLGRLSQPVTLCKLPFIAVYKNAFDHCPTIDELKTIVPCYNGVMFDSIDGFFDFPLSKAFGYTMDEIKFQTSYIPFLPKTSRLVRVNSSSDIVDIANINCGVRLQVPETGIGAKLCVASESLIMGFCPHDQIVTSDTHWDAYIYAVAENG